MFGLLGSTDPLCAQAFGARFGGCEELHYSNLCQSTGFA